MQFSASSHIIILAMHSLFYNGTFRAFRQVKQVSQRVWNCVQAENGMQSYVVFISEGIKRKASSHLHWNKCLSSSFCAYKSINVFVRQQKDLSSTWWPCCCHKLESTYFLLPQKFLLPEIPTFSHLRNFCLPTFLNSYNPKWLWKPSILSTYCLES